MALAVRPNLVAMAPNPELPGVSPDHEWVLTATAVGTVCTATAVDIATQVAAVCTATAVDIATKVAAVCTATAVDIGLWLHRHCGVDAPRGRREAGMAGAQLGGPREGGGRHERLHGTRARGSAEVLEQAAERSIIRKRVY